MEEELNKKEYTIEPISYKTAMDLVIKNHYLHRKAPCSFAFGLFKDGRICGVVTYGTPSSSTLRQGIAGKEHINNVIELNRLWVDDSVPKNGESFLIGNTVRKVNKEIIVSYAEINEGHLGVVYQATNWFYTGLSAKRQNYKVEGLDLHHQTIADQCSIKELRAKYGERFKIVERPRKHRYFYLNCGKKRKKILLKSIKYPILPYPKRFTKQINDDA